MIAKAQRVYTSTCEDCGQEFTRPSGRNLRRCYPCKRKRLEVNVDQMVQREGPYYELVVVRQVEHWTSEAQRLGINTE